MTSETQKIEFADFMKVDIRVGTIVDAMGPELGIRKTSAQITQRYRLEELVGRQVAAVVNFPPKQIGPFMSEMLVLGFPDADGNVVLVTPSLAVPNGGRLY